jgi:hypothetical protein
MLCEMYSSRLGGRPADQEVIAQCFARGVRVSQLASGSVVGRGQDKVASALSRAPMHRAKACRTLCIESVSSATSLVLAFFAPGEAPGFCSRGLAKHAPVLAEDGSSGVEAGIAGLQGSGPQSNPSALAVLVRSTEGKIDHVWVADDREEFGARLHPSSSARAELESLALWADVKAVAQESLVTATAAGGERRNPEHFRGVAVFTG